MPQMWQSNKKQQILVLTNRNTVTCHVCGSRLRVKNKGTNNAIGAVGGAFGVAALFMLIYFVLTLGTLALLGFLVTVFVALLFVPWLFVAKFVKLEVEIDHNVK